MKRARQKLRRTVPAGEFRPARPVPLVNQGKTGGRRAAGVALATGDRGGENARLSNPFGACFARHKVQPLILVQRLPAD